jgi:hypothetical protein
MADTEVRADESAHSASDKTAVKGKAGTFVEKHKALVYGGAGLALVIIWFLLRGSGSSNSAATQAATDAAQQQAADQAALASEPTANGGSDGGGGYSGWSPSGTANAGGSGSVAATPTTGLTGYTAITFAQAQKLAGKGGSSSLYYGTTSGAIEQGKYANDKNVQYYTPTPTGTTT